MNLYIYGRAYKYLGGLTIGVFVLLALRLTYIWELKA